MLLITSFYYELKLNCDNLIIATVFFCLKCRL